MEIAPIDAVITGEERIVEYHLVSSFYNSGNAILGQKKMSPKLDLVGLVHGLLLVSLRPLESSEAPMAMALARFSRDSPSK
ncbi:hypothetical protein Dimus_020767 [Dionaea muscipula]